MMYDDLLHPVEMLARRQKSPKKMKTGVLTRLGEEDFYDTEQRDELDYQRRRKANRQRRSRDD